MTIFSASRMLGSNRIQAKQGDCPYQHSYPEDREAAVFYGLALNASALPTDKTYANQRKAAEILNKVWAEQPNHPGVSFARSLGAAQTGDIPGAQAEIAKLQSLENKLLEAAAKENDIERIQAWAGQSARAKPIPAGELVRRLWDDAQALLG